MEIFEEGCGNFDLKSLTEEEERMIDVLLVQREENFQILEARFREGREEDFSFMETKGRESGEIVGKWGEQVKIAKWRADRVQVDLF